MFSYVTAGATALFVAYLLATNPSGLMTNIVPIGFWVLGHVWLWITPSLGKKKRGRPRWDKSIDPFIALVGALALIFAPSFLGLATFDTSALSIAGQPSLGGNQPTQTGVTTVINPSENVNLNLDPFTVDSEGAETSIADGILNVSIYSENTADINSATFSSRLKKASTFSAGDSTPTIGINKYALVYEVDAAYFGYPVVKQADQNPTVIEIPTVDVVEESDLTLRIFDKDNDDELASASLTSASYNMSINNSKQSFWFRLENTAADENYPVGAFAIGTTANITDYSFDRIELRTSEGTKTYPVSSLKQVGVPVHLTGISYTVDTDSPTLNTTSDPYDAFWVFKPDTDEVIMLDEGAELHVKMSFTPSSVNNPSYTNDGALMDYILFSVKDKDFFTTADGAVGMGAFDDSASELDVGLDESDTSSNKQTSVLGQVI